MDTEAEMRVTMKRVGRVWLVGCLDGTTRQFAAREDALSCAMREWEWELMQLIGLSDEVAPC